jgi:hypothetical protein
MNNKRPNVREEVLVETSTPTNEMIVSAAPLETVAAEHYVATEELPRSLTPIKISQEDAQRYLTALRLILTKETSYSEGEAIKAIAREALYPENNK